MNNVVLIGRLTRDVDLRETQDSQFVARFTLAVDRSLSKDKKQEYESRGLQTADFINIVVWGALARSCHTYLAKGRLVAVKGRIQTGSYEKDGIKRYTADVVAESVEFLEWGDKDNKGGKQTERFSDISGFSDYEPQDNDIPF